MLILESEETREKEKRSLSPDAVPVGGVRVGARGRGAGVAGLAWAGTQPPPTPPSTCLRSCWRDARRPCQRETTNRLGVSVSGRVRFGKQLLSASKVTTGQRSPLSPLRTTSDLGRGHQELHPAVRLTHPQSMAEGDRLRELRGCPAPGSTGDG